MKRCQKEIDEHRTEKYSARVVIGNKRCAVLYPNTVRVGFGVAEVYGGSESEVFSFYCGQVETEMAGTLLRMSEA